MSEHNLMAQSMITLPPTKYGEEDCKIWGSINNHSKSSYLKTVKEILSDSLFTGSLSGNKTDCVVKGRRDLILLQQQADEILID
ncbi:hypothetical protein ISN45_Aa05g013430 [Arabidopsis thaliana x Arabidopsis arenosa]|uniref:Uncharacterized protein n=1 Tax=Arabidopsis thaliana x Arabidopsis arenosa TaxID=1240361 RepID=A0A8T1ZNL8_9BRAS|nr:hypothetical protein ISN45_Aa05g013430 [Arabidopsis thaliana x Arabidopsis arenosa]